MHNKKLLIVGIDPGTTSSYAVLDIEGNLVELRSARQIGMNSLISSVMSLGKVLLVGCDKKSVPVFVEKFARSVGAKVVRPFEDMSIDYKRELTKNIKCGDYHERDSLASALFAFKRVRALLKKVDVFANKNGKEKIKDRIKEMVIIKGISISDAAEILEKPKEEEIIIEKVIKKREYTEDDFLRMYSKIKQSEKETILLKTHNRKLQNKLDVINKREEYLLSQFKYFKTDKETKALIDFKEKRIINLDKKLKEKEEEIVVLKDEIGKLYGFLSRIKDNILLKKMVNLSSSEFERAKDMLNIQKGDILLIDDPNTYSSKAVSELQLLIDVIINKKKVSRETEENLPFVFVDCELLNVEENKYFGLVSRLDLDREFKKADILNKVIQEYKKERLLHSK